MQRGRPHKQEACSEAKPLHTEHGTSRQRWISGTNPHQVRNGAPEQAPCSATVQSLAFPCTCNDQCPRPCHSQGYRIVFACNTSNHGFHRTLLQKVNSKLALVESPRERDTSASHDTASMSRLAHELARPRRQNPKLTWRANEKFLSCPGSELLCRPRFPQR